MSDQCGPGYESPEAAVKFGQREKVMFVNCARHADSGLPNFLATVDVDPDSSTCGQSQIIGQLNLLHVGDELHRSGWNACSSCYGCSKACRSHIALPCLNSSRIYIINAQNHFNLRIETVIEPEQLHELGVSFPHTTHCLADGTIMISTVGDQNGDSKGSFVLIDAKTFTLTGKWSEDRVLYGADFWYQPRWNVMVGGAWGSPKMIMAGVRMADFHNGNYGSMLSVWNWETRILAQTLHLGKKWGNMPFELRFLHNPESPVGFVAAAFASVIFRLCPEDDTEMEPAAGCPPPRYKAVPVISIPPKKVTNWISRRMPAFITTVLISMDDRFLYCSSWLHGTVRQYDISDTAFPKLIGQVFMGGLVTKDSPVRVVEDPELPCQPDPVVIKGRKIAGGPQMMQLSLDGKRLYVTTSLYSIWDKEFFPDMIEKGAVMVQIAVDAVNGGMRINTDFLVDFGEADGGPALANDMRYPGGDCSSDIWI